MTIKDFSLEKVIGDNMITRQWCTEQKLPQDPFSIENAIILKNADRWPLMIDPQLQANIWIKEMEKDRELLLIKPTSHPREYANKMEICVSLGYPILLENIGEKIDSVFNPIIEKTIEYRDGAMKMKIGENYVQYNPDFKFYITTKLTNPHYSPEICVQVTLLNFSVTEKGLID